MARATAGTNGTPSLGLALQTLTPGLARELGLAEQRGVLVRGVEDASPAANAGIRPGDIIVEADHHPIKGVDELKAVLEEHHAPTPILFLVHRNDGNLFVAIGS